MDSRSKEEAFGLDAVFPIVEEFVSREKDEDYTCGSMRRLFVDHPQLSSVFSPEWREAVYRFAEKIPMGLLIQEFNRYYNVPISKSTSVKDSKALVVKGKRKDGQLIHFPHQILENILLKIPLRDVLASRYICDDWAAVYASQQFQAIYGNTREGVIAINNNNLDIWAFILTSERWVLLKTPCDWEELGMKTLGLRARSNGLFLVARSDFNLFIVNPMTAQFKSLPRIFPDTEDRVEFLQSLIVHGTAEMEVDRITGNYTVYLFGNCHDNLGESYVHLARYASTTKLWTIQQISLYGVPLSSTSFPSPLWSTLHEDTIVCISSTFQIIDYFCNNEDDDAAAIVHGDSFMNIPATIDLKKHCGALPIMVPYCVADNDYDDDDSGFILVGRLKEDDSGKAMYGKLPIVSHFSLAIWKFDGTQWTMLHTIKADLIEDMIKSSEGTDFLVVGNGLESIWLMLRGSDSMLKYDIRRNELKLLPGCPGGGYMDANFHWQAKMGFLNFLNIAD